MPYQVKLTVFEGPLDLLLQLIERRELDITTVSLAAVTDQYLEYLGMMDDVQPDVLTDFLVIAARLILIKSQALLPRPPASEEREEESGDDLVRQLQEYKRFKDVAELLKTRDDQGLHSYIRLATSGITPRVDLEGVVLTDLAEAMRRVLATLVEEEAPLDVPRRLFTISEKIGVIEGMLSAGRVTFQRLLSGVTSRVEAIVTFLALLELLKQGRVAVQQVEIYGDITIDAGNGWVLAGDGAAIATEEAPQP
jgi:segregation and condensation protein A